MSLPLGYCNVYFLTHIAEPICKSCARDVFREGLRVYLKSEQKVRVLGEDLGCREKIRKDSLCVFWRVGMVALCDLHQGSMLSDFSFLKSVLL